MVLSTICYLDNGHQFLLLKRDKKANDIHEGKYVGVGGKFEAGETPEACAKREIFEETGLVAKKMQLCGFITFPDFTQDGRDWYSFVYRVTEFEGTLLESSPEGSLEWVDYEAIGDLPSWEGDMIFINWILEDSPYFSARFSYRDDQMIDYDVEFY